ncbi:MAG: ABC transporter permease [Bacteroidota bacterium]
MFKYVLKRLLYFVPTFIVISLITFMLGQMAPGDPVELKLKGGMGGSANGQSSEKMAGEKAYMELSEKLGKNLPAFYFSITSAAYPDTLYKIPRQNERKNLDRLISMYGNWNNVADYYKNAKLLEQKLFQFSNTSLDEASYEKLKALRDNNSELFINYDKVKISESLKTIQAAAIHTTTIKTDSTHTKTIQPFIFALPEVNNLVASYTKMNTEINTSNNYKPAFHWFGLNNQYHRWLFGDVPWFGKNDNPSKVSKGFFRGDFGNSILDNRPVASILIEAVKLTLLINFFEFFLIYLIAIPLGVSLAVKKGTSYDRIVTTLNFMLYSLPAFWIATMCIIFFTNPYYGEALNLFPDHGIGKTGADFGFWEKAVDRAYHLILPMFCMLLGAFAFISRMMRGSMLNVIRQDYIRTAFAKGLEPRKVFWKHAFRNSLIPIITMFASFLPAMISGAVIIEYIFTIPAMGRISYESVVARNFPVLFTILMFAAILTMLGNLLADILYGFVDPRISLTKKA